MPTRLAYGLSALLIGVTALWGIQFSSAEWTDQSNTPLTVGAAPDWTPPMVAVTDPGYALWGTVTIGATANDSISAIASVDIQYRADASSTWTSICPTPDTTSPYSCSWNTTAVTDGIYHLRAIALDAEGNSQTSAEVSSEVRNTAGVVIDPVASPMKGVVVLTGRVVNAGSGPTTVNFQYSVANDGAGPWNDIPGCVALPGPEGSCSFNTAPNSGTFDMRAVGTANGQTYYAVQKNIVVDNTAPVVGLTVPAGPLSGTVELTATASDANTSVASVLFEYRPAGGTWTSCPTDTSAPYSCSLATTGLTDGSHEFRATATDAVGNLITTTTVTRVVDNLAPEVTLTVPEGTLTANTELTAVATDSGTGVTGVEFQYRLMGVLPWSTCGTGADTTSPYSCTFAATNVVNGTYEFRAVASDGAGHSTATAPQSRVVQTLKLDLATIAPALTANTTLSATWSGPTATNVTFRRSPTGTGTWTNICASVVANPTATCAWSLPADGLYYVQATTTVGLATYDETQSVYVDKTAPSAASITVPTGTLNGLVTLTGTGTDATSGVRSMSFEYKLSTSGTWLSCGTDTSVPFTCDLDTTTLTDASYDFRATAFDLGGLSKISTVVSRAVDSATGTVAVTSPTSGSTVLSGTAVQVTASATSNKPITSVALQYRLVGGATWTTICTDTTSPYSCAWNNASLAYGTYEIQAVMTKTAPYTVTSAAVTFTLDRFQGSSVGATAGANTGLPGQDDTVTLTYSGQAQLNSIMPGLAADTATSVPVTISADDVAGGPATVGDYMSFPGTNLGFVTFGQNYVDNGRVVTFGGSTITANTIALGGVSVTRVTVSLSPRTDAGTAGWLNDTNATAGVLTWTPSSSVLDLSGRACSVAVVIRASGVTL